MYLPFQLYLYVCMYLPFHVESKCAYIYLTMLGVMNGPLKFLTTRKILPLLDLLTKFKRVLACSCSPNFCVARKLAKQIFYFCSCSQKNRSARHARECSQRPFVAPHVLSICIYLSVLYLYLRMLYLFMRMYLPLVYTYSCEHFM